MIKTTIPALPGNKVYLYIDKNIVKAEKEESKQLVLNVSKKNKPSEIIKHAQVPLNPKFKILQEKVHSAVPSRFNFNFTPCTTPYLTLFRRQEKFDNLIKNDKSDLGIFLSIMKWTRNAVEFGLPNPYPPWNAIEILRRGRKEGLKIFCGQYTQIMLQALLSLGYNARYVGLLAHEVLEVWSNQLNKWVLFDPLNCCYYTKNSKMLNTLEIHNLICNNKTTDIVPVLLNKSAEYDKAKEMNNFKTFNISLFTNQMLLNESGADSMANQWKRRVYWVDKYSKRLPVENGSLVLMTNIQTDLYFSLYTIKPTLNYKNQTLNAILQSNAPNLKTFKYNLNNSDWKNCKKYLSINLTQGEYLIKFKAESISGQAGPVSWVKFQID